MTRESVTSEFITYNRGPSPGPFRRRSSEKNGGAPHGAPRPAAGTHATGWMAVVDLRTHQRALAGGWARLVIANMLSTVATMRDLRSHRQECATALNHVQDVPDVSVD